MFIDISLILFGAIFRHEETTCDIYISRSTDVWHESGHPVVVVEPDGVKKTPSAMRFFTVPYVYDVWSGFEQTHTSTFKGVPDGC